MDLKKLHTKVLLKWLQFTRRFGGVYQELYNGPFVTREEIKNELNTREHILTKKESREQRKRKIKKGK